MNGRKKERKKEENAKVTTINIIKKATINKVFEKSLISFILINKSRSQDKFYYKYLLKKL